LFFVCLPLACILALAALSQVAIQGEYDRNVAKKYGRRLADLVDSCATFHGLIKKKQNHDSGSKDNNKR